MSIVRFHSTVLGARVAGVAGLWLAMFFARPLLACKCQLTLDVCGETLYSNVIFSGTAESVTPNFMTRWKPASREAIEKINRALEQYLADRSAPEFSSLKDAVRAMFPGLTADDQRRLDSADTLAALAKLFGSVLDGSRRVRFHVRTMYRKADDDDPKKADDDDDDRAQSLDLLTPVGDCGFDFQVGETYLVYASGDEETDVLATDACSRTRRLSDAGSDLAYLSFYHDPKNPSGRIQGFTTHDPFYQKHPSEPERIVLPVADAVIELSSTRWVRYTTANAFGQFVFDGLDAGDYTLTGYAPGFPENKRQLSGPQTFRLAARTCLTQVLIFSKEAP